MEGKRKCSPVSVGMSQSAKFSRQENENDCTKLQDNGISDSVLFEEFADDWPDLGYDFAEELTLDLSSWKRCKVVAIEQNDKNSLMVTLEGKPSKKRALCILRPPWSTQEYITVGIIVSVIAVKDKINPDHFVVDANDGFFVTQPDILVSGTTVVGSLFCQRRGVLQEQFRSLEGENQQMQIGTVAHAIFQQCLLDDTCHTVEDVRTIAHNLIKSNSMISSLYATKMSVDELFNLVDPYLTEIEKFIKKHLRFRKAQPNRFATDDNISICKINDIEENVWCHHLGIKGKIDATVSVAQCDNGRYEVMPLELKTGRASYSHEHQGQLALYEMMMNLVGHQVNAGLLVYLREGKCSRMVTNRHMKRDLILLRNDITRYLSNWIMPNDGPEQGAAVSLPALPEPINNVRACSKCPYNTVCVVLAKQERCASLSMKNHDFSLISDDACGHLTNPHIDYFIHWTGLIYLEQQHAAFANKIRKLWTRMPAERARNGSCIPELTLVAPVRLVDDVYFHTFSLQPELESSTNALHLSQVHSSAFDAFPVGEYVVCSTSKRIAVAAGRIVSWVGHEIVVSLERDLTVNYGMERFHLDHGSSYRSMGYNLTNLAKLLDQSEESARCRSVVIDREKPSFVDHILTPSTVPVAKEILKNLNRHQKQATLKAAATQSYCLLKGLPGTGKTQTIVGLIRLLSALGESILLTSNTHSAIDNVLRRLLPYKDASFIRLGPTERIDPAIRPFADSILSEDCDSPEKLAELYARFKIVAVTCLGAGHPMIAQRTFDYCIVDEATQVFQPTIIRVLLRCKRFLLVGDPEQLPPVVQSVAARTHGAAESLFHRLDREGSYFELPTQYRMNRVLTKIANEFTYDGKLVCGNDIVSNATLKFSHLHALRRVYEVEKWLLKTVSNQIDLSAVVLDTGNTHQLNVAHQQMLSPGFEDSETSFTDCTNISEVALVVYLCRALGVAGVKNADIGIIAPFRAQVELIRTHLNSLLEKQKTRLPLEPHSFNTQTSDLEAISPNDCPIEVNTVDQFQGKDKRCIIYSCTRSIKEAVQQDERKDRTGEILNDKRRLTVAITRAQEKLIVVGDRSSLNAYTPFNNLFNVISKASSVQIADKKDGFEWSNVIDSLQSLSD